MCIEKRPYTLYGRLATLHFRYLTCLLDRGHIISELLNILPNTEELLSKMEEQKTKIELLENENQQWQKLAQKLNSENSLLLKQNTELLNWNSK